MNPVNIRTASVIIPVRDGEMVIEQCLRSLVKLEAPSSVVEVIVVDNGSTDRTLKTVRSFSDRLVLKLIERPGVHISALRNAGAAVAQGDLLAFLDADCVVQPEWLSRAMNFTWTADCGAIGAFFVAPASSTWIARTWSRFEGAGKEGRVELLPSGNLFVRREVFRATGGFDDALETNEDSEFCRRLSERGYSILVVPELECVHLGAPTTFRAFYRREVWHGKDVFTTFVRDGYNIRAVLWTIYSFICFIGIASGFGLWILSGSPALLFTFSTVLAAGSGAIAMRSAWRTRRWGDILPMMVLVIVYGAARSHTLLDYGGRVVRGTALRRCLRQREWGIK